MSLRYIRKVILKFYFFIFEFLNFFNSAFFYIFQIGLCPLFQLAVSTLLIHPLGTFTMIRPLSTFSINFCPLFQFGLWHLSTFSNWPLSTFSNRPLFTLLIRPLSSLSIRPLFTLLIRPLSTFRIRPFWIRPQYLNLLSIELKISFVWQKGKKRIKFCFLTWTIVFPCF